MTKTIPDFYGAVSRLTRNHAASNMHVPVTLCSNNFTAFFDNKITNISGMIQCVTPAAHGIQTHGSTTSDQIHDEAFEFF